MIRPATTRYGILTRSRLLRLRANGRSAGKVRMLPWLHGRVWKIGWWCGRELGEFQTRGEAAQAVVKRILEQP